MEPLEKSLWVAGGAALGANARYWISLWMSNRFGPSFPWGTMFVNVTGSLVIGLYLGLDEARGLPTSWRFIFATGFCGGYTTFSTFSWETLKMFQEGSLSAGLANALGNAVLTICGCWLGFVLSKVIAGGNA